MSRNYQPPQVTVLRRVAADIATASINIDWDEQWSDTLQDADNA